MDRLDDREVRQTMVKYRVDRLTAEFILALKRGETGGDVEMVGGTELDRRRLGAGRSIMATRRDA